MEKEKQKKTDQKEKCFVMMPISDQGDYPPGHFTKVYTQIIEPAVAEAGYEAYRVDQNKLSGPIIEKIFTAIQECPMAVCDLSNKNPNVLYELGLRQAYDKPVVLIQDDKTDMIFDVGGISTNFYKSGRLYEDVLEARKTIKEAILATKAGKGTKSLVKIVKARKADYDSVDVTTDDKTQIMLSQLLNKLSEMEFKQEFQNSNSYCDYKTTNSKSISNRMRWIEKQHELLVGREDISRDELDAMIKYYRQKLYEINMEKNMSDADKEILKENLRGLLNEVCNKMYRKLQEEQRMQ